MNALWKISIGLVILSGMPAHGADWSEFYDEQTLRHWAAEMPPGVEENLREVIWPRLEPMEKRALSGVALRFPPADPRHPMYFEARSDGSRKTVVLPIGSLRFFGDIVLAYAWLSKNGYSIDPVTDYLAMLRYQWPDKLAGKRYLPLEALGIPKDVRANPDVMATFQGAFGTAVVFIIGHELGHLYYDHPDYAAVSAATARRNEEQADAFAMELMRKVGSAPLGMALFFTIFAHLEPPAGDENSRLKSTHPVTAERIHAIAEAIEKDIQDYAKTSASPAETIAKLHRTVTDLNLIASSLADKGVQALIRQKGLTARVETLGPRRPGERAVAAPGVPADSISPFAGVYVGKWIDQDGLALDVTMILKRQGEEVTGSYTAGDSNNKPGTAGTVSLEGLVEGDRLHYAWAWDTKNSGKGVLTTTPDKTGLSGTWGRGEAETGGGIWKLGRK